MKFLPDKPRLTGQYRTLGWLSPCPKENSRDAMNPPEILA